MDAADGMAGPEDFVDFVRRYQDMVFATAVRLLGNSADAEDVAQTVFLKAFQRFGELAENPAAPGWLKAVTRNICLNHLTRYRSRWRLFSELEREDSGASIVDSSVAAGDSPAAGFEKAARDRAIEHALQRLPAHQRVPLVLFHFEGVSYQDIADTLGISLSKVKTDIFRGRETLARLLEAHAPR